MQTSKSNIIPYDLYVKTDNMYAEIIAGLSAPAKHIPAKYLYDKRGSELFELITEQQEYYPTRTEITILEAYKSEISASIGPVTSLIEYGSGSSKKIRILLNSLNSLEEYMPIDISKEFLLESSKALSFEFPKLKIKAIYGDYTAALQLPINTSGKKVVFFPGSTIGNFEPEEANAFLRRTCQFLDRGDGLIIGVDLKKNTAILNEAYNDKNRITAAFNLNLLHRLNKELLANFQFELFEHVAFYNEEKGRIEMHLKSFCDQTVKVGQEEIHFRKNETIHTENSYKYSVQEFQSMIQECGFSPIKVWTDADQLFSVHYIQKY